MSAKHPIIAVTGSSGAGTTSVTRTFNWIFRREHINAALVEGDSFHRYDRKQMQVAMSEADGQGNRHLCHFSPEANLLEELEALFAHYGESGTGKLRHYVHDEPETRLYKQDAGTFTPWEEVTPDTDLMLGAQGKATVV